MELVQIVPTLPPAVSGVGDYATLLAGELLTRHGVGTRFVAAGDPGWNSPDAVAPFPAAAVAARSARALRPLLDGASTVLLHYVPYGYAHRGCPLWLADAMERWRRDAGPSGRLLVFFHEVYASGPPWSSAFWAHPVQRWLAARIARAADARRIATSITRRELRRCLWLGGDLPTTVAPVFSNMGEPADPPPAGARERQMVVFGSRPVREAVYAHADALAAFCARHGLARVVDVGATIPGGVRLPGGGVEVRETGVLPAAEASALFARSLAGFFSYPAPYLGKSGTFAAYCAHRMAPVTFAGNVGAEDGLRAGVHYLEGTGGEADFAVVADAAHGWYRAHALRVHADDTFQMLAEGA